MEKFKPRMYCKSIFNINYNSLFKKNIRVLIFDLDNTIIRADSSLPNDDVVELFQRLSKNFKVFIASNNTKIRVKRIGKYLGVHAFYSVFKPTKRIKKLLLNYNDVKMSEIAIIGDQLITDIFMGNRLNMYTILVDPISEDLAVTYFNRLLEKGVMKRIKLTRGEYYE